MAYASYGYYGPQGTGSMTTQQTVAGVNMQPMTRVQSRNEGVMQIQQGQSGCGGQTGSTFGHG